MKILPIHGVICILILLTVFASGCTLPDNQTNNTTVQQPATYQNHTLICPNPNCPLHDPNKGIYYSNYGGAEVRPIDCEPNTGGQGGTVGYHYVCQVCGEEWDVRI